MKDYLIEYNVELETVGPLFVGSGLELNKKEYILNNNEILVMNIPKLFEYMKSKKLTDKFEAFFIDDTRKNLRSFLMDNGIKLSWIDTCIKYRLIQPDTYLEKGTTILEFMKDPYGLPYIPGSSIKGMLRTILLTNELIKNNKGYVLNKKKIEEAIVRAKNNRNILKKEEKEIQTAAFNLLNRNEKKREDAVNDVLAGLIVSDSKPLDMKDMVLCNRIEYHVDGTEKKLNVLRECVKPNKKIYFKLTVDSTICSYTKEDIIDAIECFNKIYNECFRTKFTRISPGKDDSVYLGGGVGFASKTIIYPLFGYERGLDMTVNIFNGTGVSEKHKHNMDKRKGVSPHILKVTKYQGNLYHMGECRWKFV